MRHEIDSVVLFREGEGKERKGLSDRFSKVCLWGGIVI